MYRNTLAALAATTALLTGTALAQQNIDFSKVEVKTIDLGNKTYMLQGAGGNVTVAIGNDGYIQVDGQFAPMHDKLKAAVEKLTPLPIKYLINTHYHGDHTGGNAAFHKDGATIVAQDNIRVRLAAGTTNALTGNKTPPQPADALPTDTYYGGSKSAAARRCSTISTTPTRTATATCSLTTPTYSRLATSSATPAATTPSTSATAATSGD